MTAIRYEYIKTCKQTGARFGESIRHMVHLKHQHLCQLEHLATVKTMTPEELKQMGAGIILSNTYHLWLRPGHEIFRKQVDCISL